MKTITAAEANRKFSSVLRQVAQGEVFTVLSRGRSVASIAAAPSGVPKRNAAKKSLVSRLRSQAILRNRSWKREDLYEG